MNRSYIDSRSQVACHTIGCTCDGSVDDDRRVLLSSREGEWTLDDISIGRLLIARPRAALFNGEIKNNNELYNVAVKFIYNINDIKCRESTRSLQVDTRFEYITACWELIHKLLLQSR
jgi:hypothetical protein